MKFPSFRSGTFALIDGMAHEASYREGADVVSLRSWQHDNPLPDLYSWNHYDALWSAHVSAERCERIYSVHTYAKYRDKNVSVGKVTDFGTATIMYAEWDPAWATENGFLQKNRYEYFKTVSVSDLRDCYEKQDDLLFTRWRDENFGRSPADEVSLGERPRRGTFAVLGDCEYSVLGYRENDQFDIGKKAVKNPDSSLFAWSRERALWMAAIDRRQCDALVDIATRAEYVGCPCEVIDISASGDVTLQYAGDSAKKPSIEGFSDNGDGVWTQTVSIFNLSRYHERHTAALANTVNTANTAGAADPVNDAAVIDAE